MTTSTSTFGLPNGRLLLGDSEASYSVYRSAAASLATSDELAAAPDAMTWLDLRTPQEQAADSGPGLPPSWVVERVNAHPSGDLALTEQNAIVQQFINGTVSFGQFYVALLERSSAELARAVSVVVRANGPVLLTCQVGRDRTGVLSALLLLAVGATRDEVIADYLRTNDALLVLAERLPEMPKEFDLTCLATDIELALDYIEHRGGAQSYLIASGLPPEDLHLLLTRFSR